MEVKIVYMIFTCDNNKYKSRYNSLINRLKNMNINYLLIKGNKPYNKLQKNELYLNVEECWENLSKKLYHGLNYIYNWTEYSHVYKVDDDFNFTNKLPDYSNYDYYGNKLITNINRKYHFGKCKNKNLNTKIYEKPFINEYAAGGHGYILSREAIKILLDNKDLMYNEIYEDKAVGDILYQNSIFINKKKRTKCAVIFYHKNIKYIYKGRWIDKCIKSILNQSYNKFEIFELNYGNSDFSIFNNINLTNHKLFFYKKNYDSHIEAMNFLLNTCFYDYKYDIVFNTNLDDYYHEDRFKIQKKCVENNYDVCSTLMNYIIEKDNLDVVTKAWTIEDFNIKSESYYIESEKIIKELSKHHNIITHPSICYTKNFWNSYDIYNNKINYKKEKPYEDLLLWYRSIKNTNFTIINENLLNYRIHQNQIGSTTEHLRLNEYLTIEKRIGFFIICTGKYINFFKDLVESIEKYFLTKYNHIYFISTDNPNYIQSISSELNINSVIKFITKKGFPLDTLFRYKYLLEFDISVETLCDVIYYLDVDMKICSNIDDNILPTKETPLVGTYHPGFYLSENKNGPSCEVSSLSTAFIKNSDYNNKYIAGGFNGGITTYFIQMCKTLDENIRLDKSKDIMAAWHDESHLNKYLNTNLLKFRLLPPDYCNPENYHEKLPFEKKIIALSKDHKKIRSIEGNIVCIELKGGLGNILFQLAAGINLTKKYNYNLTFKHKHNKSDKKRSTIFSYSLFDNLFRQKINVDNTFLIIDENNYSEINNSMKNIYLKGFFQDKKFFDNIETLKKTLNLEVQKIAKSIFMELVSKFKNKNLVAIHVRGDDYVKLKHFHYNLTSKYYDDVHIDISYFYKDNIFILFTDDLNYSKQFNNYYDFTISDLLNEILTDKNIIVNRIELEFFLLSCFKTIICANSTFSLWTSYFSSADIIYVPDKWFVENDNFNIKNLCIHNKFKVINVT